MEDIREQVRERYALAITNKTGCCSSSSGGGGCCSGIQLNDVKDPITSDLYTLEDINGLDPDMILNSFGCGNPTALTELNLGEVVLDLGSGAGLDVLLSAKRVGPQGKAYGLDMTDEMLAVARTNQATAGIENVEFLKGHIEEIPLPDNSVDVIISNCVINLSGDKDKVLGEAFRVLKPGGRFAVSDIVLKKPLPAKVQRDMLAWAECIAGSLLEDEYREKLAKAGFSEVSTEVTRVYDLNDADMVSMLESLSESERNELKDSIVSAFIRARKA